MAVATGLCADRSVIDAQSYINDFDFFLAYDNGVGCLAGACYGTGGGSYFAVVKNQEASVGRYQIEVDAPSFTLPDTAIIPPDTGGHLTLDATSAGGISGFLGYYPIQLPDYHDGSLGIDTPSVPFRGLWNFGLFDESGRPIEGEENDLVTGDFNSGRTSATFTVASGPQTVYLRVNEQTENPSASSLIDVHTDLSELRAGLGPPLSALTGINLPTMLPTDPFGDGGIHDNLDAGQSQRYAYQAPAGPLFVQVMPDTPGQMSLRWGVYANIDADADLELLAWDQTDGTVASSTRVQLLLPNPRQPIRVHEYPFDLEHLGGQSIAPYHDLTILVQALPGQGNGNFTVQVESDHRLPVCAIVNEVGVQQHGEEAYFAFTAYPTDESLVRTTSEHLQSPTLGSVECAVRRPMRDRSRQMNPLSPSAFASVRGNHGIRLDDIHGARPYQHDTTAQGPAHASLRRPVRGSAS